MQLSRYLSAPARSSSRRKHVFHEWNFSATDVVVMVAMALTMSGLVGLGVVLLLEIVDDMLQ